MNLLDRLDESIIIVDKDYSVSYINNSARSIFTIEKNQHIKGIFKKDDRDIFFLNLMRIVEKYGKYSNFIRFLNKEDKMLFCWFNVFRYEEGIVFEIFDLSKTERGSLNIGDDNYVKLLKYMSEGVAHSIRNPIMAAGGMLNRLKNKLPKDVSDSVLSYIDVVEKSLYRIIHIIANIEIVSNSLPATLKKINLNKTVKDAAVKYFNYDNVNIEFSEYDDIELFADSSHIAFVIEEILKNAYDASEKKDLKIKIEIKKDRDRAIITISDNGPGINEEEIPLVMIPFYSTKPSNMGVGLSLSKFIVEGYGGKINITSEIGEGTVVVIDLPIEKRNVLRREVVNV